MRVRARALAAFTCSAAIFFVLLLYAPALQAPFLVPKFAALDVCASLGFAIFAFEHVATGRPRWTRAMTVGALLVLATSELAWLVAATRPLGAPYAVAAMARWGSLFGLACGASVLADSPRERQRVLEATTVAAGVVAAIGLLQHVELMPIRIPMLSTPGSTFGNRNLAAEVMAMALPFGVAAAARSPRGEARAVLCTSLGLELVYLAVTRTRGAWLAAACGLAVVAWLSKVRLSRATLVAGVAVVLTAGVAASMPARFNPHDAGDSKRYADLLDVLRDGTDARSTALRTRIGLWRRTLSIVRDSPLLGVGPGNWPVVFPRYAEPNALRDGVLSDTLVPRQVHDDALERTAETGLLGLGALALLAAAVPRAIHRLLQAADDDGRAHAAGAAGALASLGILSLSSFPLEMPGTLALAGLSLGWVAVDETRLPPPRTVRGVGHAVAGLGLALVACTAVRAERAVRGSWWLGRAGREMRGDASAPDADRAVASLRHSLDAAPDNYWARLSMAHALLRAGQPEAAEHAARRIMRLEPYSPNALAALAAALLAQGKPAGARQAATEALRLFDAYPAALDLHAQASLQLGEPHSAQADRSRLAELAGGPPDNETTQAARRLLHGEN